MRKLWEYQFPAPKMFGLLSRTNKYSSLTTQAAYVPLMDRLSWRTQAYASVIGGQPKFDAEAYAAVVRVWEYVDCVDASAFVAEHIADRAAYGTFGAEHAALDELIRPTSGSNLVRGKGEVGALPAAAAERIVEAANLFAYLDEKVGT